MKKRLFLFNLSALIIYYIFLSCVNGSKKIIKMNKYKKKGKNKKKNKRNVAGHIEKV